MRRFRSRPVCRWQRDRAGTVLIIHTCSVTSGHSRDFGVLADGNVSIGTKVRCGPSCSRDMVVLKSWPTATTGRCRNRASTVSSSGSKPAGSTTLTSTPARHGIQKRSPNRRQAVGPTSAEDQDANVGRSSDHVSSHSRCADVVRYGGRSRRQAPTPGWSGGGFLSIPGFATGTIPTISTSAVTSDPNAMAGFAEYHRRR